MTVQYAQVTGYRDSKSQTVDKDTVWPGDSGIDVHGPFLY